MCIVNTSVSEWIRSQQVPTVEMNTEVGHCIAEGSSASISRLQEFILEALGTYPSIPLLHPPNA